MKPRLVVCADDYGFTPGISRGIRELLAARRISATSVMAGCDAWATEASALRSVAGDADIGLHVTLTDQRPIGAMPLFAPGGRFPPMPAVYKAGIARSLPLDEIRAEIERQLAAFVEHYGAPPAHIDGHHHVHQLPGVRDIVVELAARIGGGRTWVRSGSEPIPRIVRRGIAASKALVIGAFGGATARRAARLGVRTNSGFSGAYDFARETRPMDELFGRFLFGAGDNMLIMCHPGYIDDMPAGLDAMTKAREAELAYMMSDAWLERISSAGLELGPLRR